MRNLSDNLKAEIFKQDSGDPLLELVTLNHASFTSPIRLVKNTEDIISRSLTFMAFPFQVILPTDDGERSREVKIEFDNTGLDLITSIRSVITPIDCALEYVLASNPDLVEFDFLELKIKNITYNANRISGSLYLDDFLNTGLPGEKYDPPKYPGIFS